MKHTISKSQVYSAILAIAAGLLAVHYLFKITYLDYAAFAVLVLALISYPLAALIAKGWLKLAEWLGLVNSKILLTVLFFLFLLPIALLYRLLTKDKLQLKRKLKEQSYFITRNHEYKATDLDKNW